MLIVQRLLLKSAARGSSLVGKVHPCLRSIALHSRHLSNVCSLQADVSRSLRINKAWKQSKLATPNHLNIISRRPLFTKTSHACAKCQKTSQLLKYVCTKASLAKKLEENLHNTNHHWLF